MWAKLGFLWGETWFFMWVKLGFLHGKRLLRKIFGPKKEKVTEKCENYIMRSFILCSPRYVLLGWSPKKVEAGWECGTHERNRNTYRVLAGKREGKRLRERPRRKWGDNIKICLKEVEWEGAFWICVVQGTEKCRAHVNLSEEFFFSLSEDLLAGFVKQSNTEN
jgi:hypothetical protein